MAKSEKEKQFYDKVWRFWCPEGTSIPPCLVCYKKAITLHEIDPRSTNLDWLDQPFNSVPVCNRCHENVQLDPTSSSIKLRALATERAHHVTDWKGKDYNRVIRKLYPEEEK